MNLKTNVESVEITPNGRDSIELDIIGVDCCDVINAETIPILIKEIGIEEFFNHFGVTDILEFIESDYGIGEIEEYLEKRK